MSRDTARSDFFLIAALLFFGHVITSFFPFTFLPMYMRGIAQVLLTLLLYGFTPLWLQNVRNESLSELFMGGSRSFLNGILMASPFILGVGSEIFSEGLIFFTPSVGLLLSIVKWFALALCINLMALRAPIAFAGFLMPAKEFIVKAGVVCIGIGAVGAGFATLMADMSLFPLLSVLSAGAMWLLVERITNVEGNIQRAAWMALLIVPLIAEVNIFSLFYNPLLFMADSIRYASLASFSLVALTCTSKADRSMALYGTALVYGLLQIPTITASV